ncbi:AbiJ-NTD4 domain-containing protein [Candidatus Methanarcanum hacksteinii]|uniref:AbiJ-NTD4 domain-containing protein n=1 Tax=Candidatus Methanarcanum hacksteinii TaxID=2911857 RepID=UPI0037DD0A5B
MMYRLLSERMFPSPPSNVLITDHVPEKARNQLLFVLRRYYDSNDYGCNGVNFLPKESLYHYAYLKGYDPDSKFLSMNVYDVIKVFNDKELLDYLDIICFKSFNNSHFKSFYWADFVEEINDVLITNSMGYTVANNQLIPCTDIKEAEEIIIPSYHTMFELNMKATSDHLDDAYDHFKNRRNQDAILSTFKAMESAIEQLLDNANVTYSKDETTSKKMEKLADKLNMESYLTEDLKKIVSLLKIPGEIRNKNAGHGSVDHPDVEDHLVKYEIDLVASSILFLARCCCRKNIKP